MKAMGLSSAKVFSPFSVEAVVIVLIGSALGFTAIVSNLLTPLDRSAVWSVTVLSWARQRQGPIAATPGSARC